MKYLALIFFIVSISVLLTTTVSAQIVTITEAEFEAAGNPPERPLDSTEHTEISVGTRFFLGKPTKTTERTRQIDPKGNVRSFGIVKDDKGSETFERITINKELTTYYYSRKNAGEWTLIELGCAAVFATDEPEDLSLVYTLDSTGPEKLYTMTKEYTENGLRILIVSKKFVNQDGYLVRTEFEQSEGSPDNFIYRSYANYGYSDGKLKIEGPIN